MNYLCHDFSKLTFKFEIFHLPYTFPFYIFKSVPLDNTSFISDCEQFENIKVQIISFRFDKMRDTSIYMYLFLFPEQCYAHSKNQ